MRFSFSPQRQHGNAAGKVITGLLALGLLGLGGWLVSNDLVGTQGNPLSSVLGTSSAAPTPIEALTTPPVLQSAAPYEVINNIVDIDMSEYAGYGGLIVANGGLEPNPESFFAKNYGFQVRLSKGESEEWSALNNGQMAAVATTADVMAVLGRQFDVNVPAQIAFSRGADQLVVDSNIASVNQLKGKVLAASQFNESEFFIRYLASEAGVPVRVLRDLNARPAPQELGLVFYEDAFVACDAYEAELSDDHRLNGCIGWSPRTDEVVAESAGAAKMLVSNRNLLVVADILVVNNGFAKQHPEMVKGLVHGLMEGNSLLRNNPEAHADTVAKAFGWTRQETLDELKKVHLSNLPENLAFFDGSIDSAGSFQSIFQSSVLAYGALIRNPTDPARFVDDQHLKALQQDGLFQGQSIAIAPIRTSGKVALEGDALLSKDIRFFFEANSAELDKQAQENLGYLDTIKQFLQVSPGSIVLLRGHVDNSLVPDFQHRGGPALVQRMALKAMALSKQRAQAVKDALLTRHPNINADRIELVGRGWEEPQSQDSELNRRVEVQWFTLE
ncbi:phosphate ABC transporter substrate-binding/OmpA family protein [Atopomonas sediminilitoris]|uniref:phosphate ABC transporter substrate-binding/OmpA family protein n=1 Tax=Atopomonas sediminilitoris TaxID=2919919 RepID=UPI001F4E86F1|nr:phosphate ABC transporter substrate-binding/OmpA family protein [Atopomonas sediminilitoris]MCJ8168164.1 phosphate ABC transporter substrate-binding/OmpA family protein [Atopomonas sediminilitoris]